MTAPRSCHTRDRGRQTHAARAADKIGGENREKRSLLRGKHEALEKGHRIYRKATNAVTDRRETRRSSDCCVAQGASTWSKDQEHVSLACSACERAHRKMFAKRSPDPGTKHVRERRDEASVDKVSMGGRRLEHKSVRRRERTTRSSQR